MCKRQPDDCPGLHQTQNCDRALSPLCAALQTLREIRGRSEMGEAFGECALVRRFRLALGLRCNSDTTKAGEYPAHQSSMRVN